MGLSILCLKSLDVVNIVVSRLVKQDSDSWSIRSSEIAANI